MRSALKITSEKPALESDFEAEKVAKKAVFGDFSPADLPRNEGQIRPLIEKLEHNGERLKVWADAFTHTRAGATPPPHARVAGPAGRTGRAAVRSRPLAGRSAATTR